MIIYVKQMPDGSVAKSVVKQDDTWIEVDVPSLSANVAIVDGTPVVFTSLESLKDKAKAMLREYTKNYILAQYPVTKQLSDVVTKESNMSLLVSLFSRTTDDITKTVADAISQILAGTTTLDDWLNNFLPTDNTADYAGYTFSEKERWRKLIKVGAHIFWVELIKYKHGDVSSQIDSATDETTVLGIIKDIMENNLGYPKLFSF